MVADGGHFGSLAEGGTFPSETAFHRVGRDPRAEPAVQPRPGCWAPPPGGRAAAPCGPAGTRSSSCPARGAGELRWCGKEWGLMVAPEGSGCLLPVHSLAAPHLGLRGSFSASTAPACPVAARLPPQPETAEELALLAQRPSLAAAAGREGATAGCCRAASGGREPSARSRHLEPRQRAGVRLQGRGLAARPEAHEGKGSERGSIARECAVEECVCPWRGGAELALLSPLNSRAGHAKEPGTSSVTAPCHFPAGGGDLRG